MTTQWRGRENMLISAVRVEKCGHSRSTGGWLLGELWAGKGDRGEML